MAGFAISDLNNYRQFAIFCVHKDSGELGWRGIQVLQVQISRQVGVMSGRS